VQPIETVICLVLLIMAVPDFARWLGRPALAYPTFVVFGILLSPLVDGSVHTMLVQAGGLGFLLLLFEIGLEIELPRLREFLPHLRRALIWAALQYPPILALAHLAGLSWLGAFIAAAAFTGCSVSMSYLGWKHYPGLTDEVRRKILLWMLALEIVAIVLLSVETTLYGTGVGWSVVVKLAGIGATIYLISRFATRLQGLFQRILQTATQWRVHFLVLLVFVVCAIGERLGLAANKTAFFLGLFMSRIRHEGQHLEDFISPISRRFLIPIFFVSLGLQIPWSMLLSPAAPVALAAAAVLLAWRWVIHRRLLPTGGDGRSFLLLCPNLTMVALGATVLLADETLPRAAAWMVLVGLFMSIAAIVALPRPASGLSPSPRPGPDPRPLGDGPAPGTAG
jgi:Kef-type K+ transport system membrane component KefB